MNQTGPLGQGPMTGRRMGRCTNYGTGSKKQHDAGEAKSRETDMNETFMPGRGFGFRRGGGGWGCGRGAGRGFGMGRQNRFRGGSEA